MGKIKVSIAMTSYNGEKYIGKQLKSIFEQTIQPDEVVIFDDASADKTVEIIRDFIKTHKLESWRLFTNNSNVGYKKNFYSAIKETSGDVIFLADQDDEWCSEKIEHMLSIFKENRKISALSCAVKLIDGDSHEVEYACKPDYYNCDFLYLDHAPVNMEFFDFAYVAKHNISPGCTTAITRLLAENFLETYNFELPHDWFLNLLAAAKNGCTFLNEPLIRYRRHSNNTIGANNGVVSGIRKKTRSVRIEDYRYRTRAIQIISNGQNLEENEEELKDVIDLYRQMIDFYESPSLFKLMRIRKNKNYYELAKRKVRVWEFIVALRLDNAVTKLLG